MKINYIKASIYFMLMSNIVLSVTQEEKDAFKKSSQAFSSSLNKKNFNNLNNGKLLSGSKDNNKLSISSTPKASSSSFSSFFGSKSSGISTKGGSKDNVASTNKSNSGFFGSLFGSKSSGSDKKNSIVSKKESSYEDPFGSMDTSLFAEKGEKLAKNKLKSSEQQKNSDQKKESKKLRVEKALNAKNDTSTSSWFSSFKNTVAQGAKAAAKSDIGKSIGGVLKDATGQIVGAAVNKGVSKLNEGVVGTVEKINGVSSENASLVNNNTANLDVNSNNIKNEMEDPFVDLEDNALTYEDDANKKLKIEQDIKERNDLADFKKSLDNKNNSSLSIMPSGSQGFSNGNSRKKTKKSKKKISRKR
jgi:hypothetical protein